MLKWVCTFCSMEGSSCFWLHYHLPEGSGWWGVWLQQVNLFGLCNVAFGAVQHSSPILLSSRSPHAWTPGFSYHNHQRVTVKPPFYRLDLYMTSKCIYLIDPCLPQTRSALRYTIESILLAEIGFARISPRQGPTVEGLQGFWSQEDLDMDLAFRCMTNSDVRDKTLSNFTIASELISLVNLAGRALAKF